MACATLNSRETLRDWERVSRDRSRGGDREREGGGRSWKLEKDFKPKTKMNLEMTKLELQIWERNWMNYYEISKHSESSINHIHCRLPRNGRWSM